MWPSNVLQHVLLCLIPLRQQLLLISTLHCVAMKVFSLSLMGEHMSSKNLHPCEININLYHIDEYIHFLTCPAFTTQASVSPVTIETRMH